MTVGNFTFMETKIEDVFIIELKAYGDKGTIPRPRLFGSSLEKCSMWRWI